MAKYTCTCGARYKFPDSAAGKRARCKKCGAVFTLPEEEDEGLIPIADEDNAFEEAAKAAAAMPRQGALFVPPDAPGAAAFGSLDAGGIGAVLPPARSFASDVVWTFLFPTRIGNLITWLAIWLTMSVVQMVCLCLPIQLLIIGWYCAFLFAVVESAAGGDADLPDVSLSRDIVGEIVAPFFKWVGSWAVVLLPALAYLIYGWRTGSITGAESFSLLTGGLPVLLQPASSGFTIFEVLVAIGVFLWPMILLCIALGGFESLYRLDLILFTIIRTIGVYTLTIVLMFIAVVIEYQLNALASGALVGAGGRSIGGLMSAAMALGALAVGLSIYFDIVLMRLIGLYYHHFKRKFAWDWG